mmetsp:Transcript_38889/g.91575  ORF Transcript_38889/g.91575 Transcript_38889/m.91575 type:complete len:302 (+) Transcript_38889:84-989(+)
MRSFARALFFVAFVAGGRALLVHREELSLSSSSEELASDFTAAAAAADEEPTREFLKSFEICGACSKWQRYGEFADGGYLMCMDHRTNAPQLQAAFSLGVEHHDQWSYDVSEAFAVPVYQLDCTVQSAPEDGCSQCHFFQKCMKAADGYQDNFPGRSWSLQEMLENTDLADAAERSLIMKMDIESSEWAIFERENTDLLKKFDQIIVEFHGLRNSQKHEQYLKAMQTILASGFKVAHLHGNSFAGMYQVGDYKVPNVVEVTFTSGPARNQCAKEQEYFRHLDHVNGASAGMFRELPMAVLP